jgi:hypothetical protein
VLLGYRLNVMSALSRNAHSGESRLYRYGDEPESRRIGDIPFVAWHAESATRPCHSRAYFDWSSTRTQNFPEYLQFAELLACGSHHLAQAVQVGPGLLVEFVASTRYDALA